MCPLRVQRVYGRHLYSTRWGPILAPVAEVALNSEDRAVAVRRRGSIRDDHVLPRYSSPYWKPMTFPVQFLANHTK